MLQEAGQTAYLGCVGSDKYADTMREVCAKDGIAVHYMVEGPATGTCAVCVVDNDRSLVANLAAANNYKACPSSPPPLPDSSASYSIRFGLHMCFTPSENASRHTYTLECPCPADAHTHADTASWPLGRRKAAHAQTSLLHGMSILACRALIHVDCDMSVTSSSKAVCLQADHLKQPEIASIMDGAKVIYSAGFFITACSEAVIASAEHCLSNKKTYAVVRPTLAGPHHCPHPALQHAHH